jgi:hypothetical protein
LNFINFLKKID